MVYNSKLQCVNLNELIIFRNHNHKHLLKQNETVPINNSFTKNYKRFVIKRRMFCVKHEDPTPSHGGVPLRIPIPSCDGDGGLADEEQEPDPPKNNFFKPFFIFETT